MAMAVRAVDDEGRLELKSRWFAHQIGHLRVPILILALMALFLVLFPVVSLAVSVSSAPTGGAALSALVWSYAPSAAFTATLTTLAVGLIASRWPQLVRPLAICFMVSACQNGLRLLGGAVRLVSLVLSVLGAKSGLAELGVASAEWMTGLVGAGTVFTMVWDFAVMFVYFYLGRRVWVVGEEYRRLAATSLRSWRVPAARRLIGALAWLATVACSLGLLGTEALTVYRGAAANLAGDSDGNFDRNRAEIARQVNDHAWRQITDSDPAKRGPNVALTSYAPALRRESANPLFLKTLGVIYYRNGDYVGSIESLEKCIKIGGFDAAAAFFLAAAHTRAGQLKQAQERYDEAVNWMTANQSSDDELKRFQVESAAVLYLETRGSRTPEGTREPPWRGNIERGLCEIRWTLLLSFVFPL